MTDTRWHLLELQGSSGNDVAPSLGGFMSVAVPVMGHQGWGPLFLQRPGCLMFTLTLSAAYVQMATDNEQMQKHSG